MSVLRMACLTFLFPFSHLDKFSKSLLGFGFVKIFTRFTTSMAEETLSCHLLKNVPLKGSILEVSGWV